MIIGVGFASPTAIRQGRRGLPGHRLRDRRRRHGHGRQRHFPGLRRGAGLVPRRRGGRPHEQDREARLHRWRRGRPHQEVRGRLRGRRPRVKPDGHGRRQVHHRSRRTSPASTIRPRARRSPLGQYGGGADVVYHAAGGSGAGLFEAALPDGQRCMGHRRRLRPVVDRRPRPCGRHPHVDAEAGRRRRVRGHQVVHRGQARGRVSRRFDLANDGVGYATTGDFLTRRSWRSSTI